MFYLIEIQGRTCRLALEDLGAMVQGIRRDETGKLIMRFDAVTTRLAVFTPGDMAPSGKLPICQIYSQTDIELMRLSGDPPRFRSQEDAASLEDLLNEVGASDSEIIAAIDVVFGHGLYQPAV